MLDYPLEEVHEEAERLEHFISERFEERIAAKLGHPATDPHGHCIPAMDGKMPAQNSRSLAEIQELGEFIVVSISDNDASRFKYLANSGIAPGAALDVKARHTEGGCSLTVGRSTGIIRLSRDAADAIRVQPRRSIPAASRVK
jgi:DtxR family Mn-dependent transcriptional regulator